MRSTVAGLLFTTPEMGTVEPVAQPEADEMLTASGGTIFTRWPQPSVTPIEAKAAVFTEPSSSTM